MRKLLVFLLVFSVLFISGSITLDPDFGWHLKMGQLIKAGGIPKTDPFSYTMPSYPEIDHEWLSDVVIASLYPKVGIEGLTAFFAAIAALSIAIVSFSKKYWLAPVILATSIFWSPMGIRPLIFTWFFFAILTRFLFDKKMWDKWRFTLPFLFVVWANLHGGFAIGIGTLVLFLAIKVIKTKTLNFKDIALFAMCLLATLVNPYGVRLWHEVFMTMWDFGFNWHFYISEWEPTIGNPDSSLVILICIISVITFVYRKSLEVWQIIFFVFLALLSLSAKRQPPLFAIFSIPFFSVCFSQFYKNTLRIPKATTRLEKTYKILVIICLAPLVFFISEGVKSISMHKGIESTYPTNAVVFLQKNPFSGNLFSHYNWGGYLIWKLPQKKVFIDGRMPSWSFNAPRNESPNAFKEYLSIIQGREFQNAAIKYSIKRVLIPKDRDLEKIIEKAGFKKIFEDKISIIYLKT